MSGSVVKARTGVCITLEMLQKVSGNKKRRMEITWRDVKRDKVDGLVRCCDERQRCEGASAQYFHFLKMSEIKECSSPVTLDLWF